MRALLFPNEGLYCFLLDTLSGKAKKRLSGFTPRIFLPYLTPEEEVVSHVFGNKLIVVAQMSN